MAWAKAKMAIVAGVVIVLAAGTTTLVVNKAMALSASDLSWADDPKYWVIDPGNPDPQMAAKSFGARSDAFNRRIEKLPPVLIIRPTKFRTNLFEIASGDKIIGRGRRLSDLLRDAYDPGLKFSVILPSDLPKERFDLMLTLSDKPREALQQALKTRFGYVAHVETIETNALLLRVKTSTGRALQPTKGGEPSYPTRSPQNKIFIKNQQSDGIAACFGALLHTLVIDQTDIKGRYDIALKWETRGTETPDEALQRTVLDELGLEFVPARQSKEYLIVEKVK
jgi:uncharacterized protein (TIGR03435 family)